MTTYYSIVFTPINLVSQERLNLGIIMLNNQGKVIFQYSQEKLAIAKKLFTENSYKLLKTTLSSIEKKLAVRNDFINDMAGFKIETLEYLSNYNNNLIAFTKPQVIDMELTKENYNKIFFTYIFKDSALVQYAIEKTSSIIQVKESFIPRIKKRVNVDVTLNADIFDFVMFDTHVDMMGKNEEQVLNQFIDFNKTPLSIQKEIASYLNLIKPLEIKEGKPGKYFVTGDEPLKNYDKQHLIWKHLRESTLIRAGVVELVPTNEIDLIEEYLESHDVQPYFPKDEN